MDRVLFFYQKIFKTLILLGFFSFLLLMPEKVTVAAPPELGVVGVERLNMRQGRGIDQPLVKVLKKGDQVQVLSRSQGWIKIRHEGDEGYISARGHFINLSPDSGTLSRKTPKLDAAAAKAADILRQIKQQASEVSAFNKQEKRILNRLDETDRALSDARQKAAAMEFEMKRLSYQISEMKNKAREVQTAIDAKSGYAVKRLVALYKADRLGEMNLLASATTLNDLLHRKAALEKILIRDSQVVAGLAAEKKRLSRLMNESAQKIEKQETLKKDYQKAIAALSAEKTERERLLSEIKGEKINRLATIKYLKAASLEMDKTIEALRQEQVRAQQKAEARALAEAQKRERLAAQKEVRKQARRTMEENQGEVAADARIREPEKVRSKKTAHAAKAEKKPVRRTAAKNLNKNDFSAHQGLLKMPVSGSIVSRFGKYIEPHSGAVNFRNGIEIKTQQGTPIRAVFSGQTIFSSWLKGYGNVIIIAHGEHFHTVYAHVQEVFSAKGKPVEAGEVIATVGDSGSMSGPSLYFEIRRGGTPVDPLEWVNKS